VARELERDWFCPGVLLVAHDASVHTWRWHHMNGSVRIDDAVGGVTWCEVERDWLVDAVNAYLVTVHELVFTPLDLGQFVPFHRLGARGV
jgi:hypothetical protein